MKNHITRYQIATTPAVIEHSKKDATEALTRFKWSEEQKSFLEAVAKKGYKITTYQEVLPLFGRLVSPNETDKKQIMTARFCVIGRRRKKDLSVYGF